MLGGSHLAVIPIQTMKSGYGKEEPCPLPVEHVPVEPGDLKALLQGIPHR
jgi:hypothetical protein